MSLKSLEKKEGQKKERKKIEKELPFFITIVTLFSTSGLGPYAVLDKMKEIKLLPAIKKESEKILHRIDFLGLDPLVAMEQAKDNTSSKELGDFFGGYVASINSGGDVMNYLTSKMDAAYEKYAEFQKQSIEKVQGIIEAYMTIQIVMLAVFVIVAAIGNNPMMGGTSSEDPYYLIILPIIVAALFLKLAQNVNPAKTKELQIKYVAKIIVPIMVAAVVIIGIGIFSDLEINSYILGVAFIAASILPALKFKKLYDRSIDGESATPDILRNITETRRVGVSPEKCIIQACERKNYGLFNPIANSIANRLKWGVSLKNIYTMLEKDVNNFHILISMKILFEVISSGGGNVTTLDSLTKSTERIHTIEKNKREMTKPYLMVGFMLVGITGFSTMMVLDSFANVANIESVKEGTKNMEEINRSGMLQAFSLAVIVQSWISGLFLGKIITGNYSCGYKYAIILVVISIASIAFVQSGVFSISSMFN